MQMRLLLPQCRLQFTFLIIFGLVYIHLVPKTNSSQIRRFMSTYVYKHEKAFDRDSTNRNNINEKVGRHKRDAIQLAMLLQKSTKYNVEKLLDYGNYCGVGGDRAGDGSVIDKCDDCCKTHDNCYDGAMYTNITDLEHKDFQGNAKTTRHLNCIPYILTYRLGNITGDPYCIVDKINNSKSGIEEASCASKICECDLQFAKCLQKEPCPLF